MTNGPVFNGGIQNDFVPKKYHMEQVLIKAAQDFGHGFGPSFLVHGANAQPDPIVGKFFIVLFVFFVGKPLIIYINVATFLHCFGATNNAF